MLIKFNEWSYRIDLVHRETVVVLHQFLLLLSVHSFLDRVLEGDAFLISLLEKCHHLLSSLEGYFHFGAYSLLELLQYLERLVKSCRTYSQRIVLDLSVKLRFKVSCKGNAVVQFDFSVF